MHHHIMISNIFNQKQPWNTTSAQGAKEAAKLLKSAEVPKQWSLLEFIACCRTTVSILVWSQCHGLGWHGKELAMISTFPPSEALLKCYSRSVKTYHKNPFTDGFLPKCFGKAGTTLSPSTFGEARWGCFVRDFSSTGKNPFDCWPCPCLYQVCFSGRVRVHHWGHLLRMPLCQNIIDGHVSMMRHVS